MPARKVKKIQPAKKINDPAGDKVAVATVRIYQRLMTVITIANVAGLIIVFVPPFYGMYSLFTTGVIVMLSAIVALVMFKAKRMLVLKWIITIVAKKKKRI